MKKLTLIYLMAGLLGTSAYCQPKRSHSYVDPETPGMTARLFAPGIVSTDSLEHSAPAFSPDGSVVLWTVIHRFKPAFLLESRNVLGTWTKPARPSFSDPSADDFYPSFSAEGNKLFFSSRRKAPDGYKEGLRIWEVSRKDRNWGTPVPMDTVLSQGEDYAHSVTQTGDMYFSFRRNGGKIFDIAHSKFVNGRYGKPDPLPANINTTAYEDGPFVAPDGSYLIFESGRPGGIKESIDLYISFRNKDAQWTQPVNMGPKINTEHAERFARVSPDGKYLFFGSSRSGIMDIYWIDAKVIEELKK
jgi:Tol biopolymer transport system component